MKILKSTQLHTGTSSSPDEVWSKMKILLPLLVILAVSANAAYGNQHDDGWFEFRDSRYFFNKNFKTWFNSSEECRELGARLVTVNDVAENNFLVGILQSMQMAKSFAVRYERVNNYYNNNPYEGNSGGSIVWIGLNDLHHEGLWQWVDSNDFISYNYWEMGQPDNWNDGMNYNGYYYYGEHCGHYGRSTSSMRWGDTSCYFLGTSICEMKKWFRFRFSFVHY